MTPNYKAKLLKIIFNAESVAHLQGYEREILPATDLIKEMIDILAKHDLLNEIEFKEFIEFI